MRKPAKTYPQKKRTSHHAPLAKLGILGAAASDLHKHLCGMTEVEYRKFLDDLKMLHRYKFRADRDFIGLWNRLGRGASTKKGQSFALLMHRHLFQVAQYYYEADSLKNPWRI